MAVLPDRLILRVLRIGVEALRADQTPLDHIWSTLNAGDLVKAKEYFVKHPPEIVQGYPRFDKPFPVFAVPMISDVDSQEFLDEADHFEHFVDEDEIEPGETQVRSRRRTESIGIYILEGNPDLCALYYRVAKRILEVATPHLIKQGLDLTRFQGAEVAPDAQMISEQMFMRRLTISFDYDEEWVVGDSLWIAINGAAEPYTAEADKVDAYRSDVSFVQQSPTRIDTFGGTITTPEEDE